jgi:hypothetical protein
MPRKVPSPPQMPGFSWRVGLSIIVVFAWVIFLILWLLFYAGSLSVYQNIAVVFVSILVGLAIMAAAWASWGIAYGWKYKNDWQKGKTVCDTKSKMCCGGSGGAIYGLGFVGALIYYVTTAPTFWEAVIGFFKAIVWPAFLVYGALKSLGL